MATDAPQTQAALLTLYSDNKSGNITPQYGRNLILSVSGLARLGPYFSDAYSNTLTFDVSLYPKHQVQLGGNPTLAVAGDSDGLDFDIILQQGTGGQTVTWWSGILWQGGISPILSMAANKRDRFQFTRLASGLYLGRYALNF